MNDTAVNAILVGNENSLQLNVVLLTDLRLRIFITEHGEPLRNRFHPSIALNGEPEHTKSFLLL